ncbi:MAG: CNNM domain-containing protein, partial [Chthoniobacteraceae bacterium]
MNLAVFLASSEAMRTEWDSGGIILLKLAAVALLVSMNGFFVAAEFAIVKVRSSQLEAAEAEGNKRASFARHVTAHLDAYLSATQLGITLASLGLGWIGEPFLAAMIQPLLLKLGISSPAVVHSIAFALGFSIISFLHIVLGELAPKSLAIRKSVGTALLVSRPLGFFYTLFKPA